MIIKVVRDRSITEKLLIMLAWNTESKKNKSVPTDVTAHSKLWTEWFNRTARERYKI